MTKKINNLIFIFSLCVCANQIYAEPKWSHQFNQQGNIFLVDEHSPVAAGHFVDVYPMPNATINNIQFLDTRCVSAFIGEHESPALFKMNNQIYSDGQRLNLDEQEMANLSQLSDGDKCSPIFHSKRYVYQLIVDEGQKKLLRLNELTPQDLSIQSFYFIKDQERVFYRQPSDEPYTTVFQLLSHADSGSFEVIKREDEEDGYHSYYAKDKNHVFYLDSEGDQKGSPLIKNADPMSFQLLPISFAKDMQRLFYQGKEIGLINGDSFRWLDNASWQNARYAEDKNHLYFVNSDKATRLPFDRESFSILDERLATDKNGVYLDGQALKGLSREGIEFISFNQDDLSKTYIVKNKDGLFGIRDNDGSIVPMQEVEGAYVALLESKSSGLGSEDTENNQLSVEKYSSGAYTKDSQFIYYSGQKIDGADFKSFEFLADAIDLAKDKNHIYFRNHIIEGWDGQSARVTDSGFLIDKNQFVFLMTKELFADLDQFIADKQYSYSSKQKPLILNNVIRFQPNENHELIFFGETGYSKTNQRVFYNEKEVLGAQAKTFRPLTKYPTFMSDGKSIISNGVVWAGTDPKSFREYKSYEMRDGHSGTYYRDRNHLFTENGEMVIGADPDSYRLLTQGYGKDKKSVFYEDKMIVNSDASGFQVIKKEVVIPCLSKNAQSVTSYFLGQDKNQLYLNGMLLTDKDLFRFNHCEHISTE